MIPTRRAGAGGGLSLVHGGLSAILPLPRPLLIGLLNALVSPTLRLRDQRLIRRTCTQPSSDFPPPQMGEQQTPPLPPTMATPARGSSFE